MGVRASYVAVVIVAVGVDASLIPVNGLLGLNRRGAFVWAGSIIHLLHSRPWGSGGGSGIQHWHGTNAQSISVRRFPSFHPSSVSSLTFLPLGSNAETVITQSLAMILGFHVLQDFMSDESMCFAGPCAVSRRNDARPQTAPSEKKSLQEAAPGINTGTKGAENFVPTADRSSFNAVDPDESQTVETKICLLTSTSPT